MGIALLLLLVAIVAITFYELSKKSAQWDREIEGRDNLRLPVFDPERDDDEENVAYEDDLEQDLGDYDVSEDDDKDRWN